MKIEVKVGDDVFTGEADRSDPFMFRMFYLWIRSLGKGDQDKLDALARELDSNSGELEKQVQKNQVP